VEGRKRKGEKCCALCLAREACDDCIAISERRCNYSYHREAVAKKATNKNVFTWKIKCNFKVHDCYVLGMVCRV
jgi:hypothetical protein